ncbi:putative iron-sulfur cluster-binding metallochaperone [Thiolapillus brandeum]|uniref:CopZ zinc binding domain-containing protein n=1 Tax=Thiolapillus brandeum TaxID=1076588 RepID=A0A7U6GJ83_9GAMM|nr:hypothetical protein [Thiolapillus brandeum]BAO44703.1 conserved hypothetical protein [Thiolapillus brandeum]
MGGCCTTPATAKHPCPHCGQPGNSVDERTLLHHLKAPWDWMPQDAWFCENPNCGAIYFLADGNILEQADLRTPVGIKNPGEDALLCYCFGIDRKTLAARPALKDFVIERTRNSQCDCAIRNPSGRCCLKDFPR